MEMEKEILSVHGYLPVHGYLIDTDSGNQVVLLDACAVFILFSFIFGFSSSILQLFFLNHFHAWKQHGTV